MKLEDHWVIRNPFLNVSHRFFADKGPFGGIMYSFADKSPFGGITYSSASNYDLFISYFISINQSRKTLLRLQ